MFRLLKQEGAARRGEFETVHGVIQTPVFMNVGTSAAIKGAVSSVDLEGLKCQVELCNTYHLHIRPGDDVIYKMGGLHKFMNWHRPILTDSGGFQVFSLAKLRRIKEKGVYFQSHLDGKKIFMGPDYRYGFRRMRREPRPEGIFKGFLRADSPLAQKEQSRAYEAQLA